MELLSDYITLDGQPVRVGNRIGHHRYGLADLSAALTAVKYHVDYAVASGWDRFFRPFGHGASAGTMRISDEQVVFSGIGKTEIGRHFVALRYITKIMHVALKGHYGLVLYDIRADLFLIFRKSNRIFGCCVFFA